jgi:GT2 family glycosyltransferase
MSISIVVPTTLQRPTAQKALESIILSAQQISNSQVILAVNGLGVSNPRIRIDSSIVTVVTCETASASASRNIGLEAVENPIVLFTDDDCIVPPTWCKDIAKTLSHPNTLAVAAPVSVEEQGPITAFLNYQRIFDAPPFDDRNVRYLITANCGIYWDLLKERIRFDDLNFVVGGEDTEFGYAINDLGFKIEWISHVEPVYHIIPESINEITDRFTRYGRASARLFIKNNRYPESVPNAVDWLRDISLEQYYDYRCFIELTNPLIQRAFVSFELMLTSAFLISYLDELSDLLDYCLISPDYDALRTNWQEIASEVVHELNNDSSIRNSVTVDFGKWSNQFESGYYKQPLDKIAWNIRNNAPLASSIPSKVNFIMNSYSSYFVDMQKQQCEQLHELISKQWEKSIQTPQSMAYAMRKIGISFRDGCHEVERIFYNSFKFGDLNLENKS